MVLFKAHGADILLTHVFMPDHDGLEVIMEIRGGKNPTPILAMTGHRGETDFYRRLAKSLGAQRTLAKPFRIEQLLATIDELAPPTTPK